MAVAMLSRGGRRWGYRDNNSNSKEKIVEEDNNGKVGGRQKAKRWVRGVLKENGGADGADATAGGGGVVNKLIPYFIYGRSVQ